MEEAEVEVKVEQKSEKTEKTTEPNKKSYEWIQRRYEQSAGTSFYETFASTVGVSYVVVLVNEKDVRWFSPRVELLEDTQAKKDTKAIEPMSALRNLLDGTRKIYVYDENYTWACLRAPSLFSPLTEWTRNKWTEQQMVYYRFRCSALNQDLKNKKHVAHTFAELVKFNTGQCSALKNVSGLYEHSALYHGKEWGKLREELYLCLTNLFHLWKLALSTGVYVVKNEERGPELVSLAARKPGTKRKPREKPVNERGKPTNSHSRGRPPRTQHSRSSSKRTKTTTASTPTGPLCTDSSRPELSHPSPRETSGKSGKETLEAIGASQTFTASGQERRTIRVDETKSGPAETRVDHERCVETPSIRHPDKRSTAKASRAAAIEQARATSASKLGLPYQANVQCDGRIEQHERQGEVHGSSWRDGVGKSVHTPKSEEEAKTQGKGKTVEGDEGSSSDRSDNGK